eukprot:scaffold30124_cov68-Phaeocystis_antarctica.AAC.1
MPLRTIRSIAGSAPLSRAEARAAQPASPPFRGGSTPVGDGGATRGEALVAERVAIENEHLQRGEPPQGRREGHQPCVAYGGDDQVEALEPRHGASAQGGGERQGACVAHMQVAKREHGHGRQRAHSQPRRQPLHAVGAGCAC